MDSVHNKKKVYGLVLRLDATGKIIWSRFIGFVATPYDADTRIYASAICRNGDIILSTGNSASGIQGGNIIVRLDGNGNLVWAKRIAIPIYLYINEDIIETSDGGFLMGGPNSSVAEVTKLDAAGNLQWYRTFSNYTYVNCRSVVESPSAYYFTGYSYDFGSDSSRNYLVKMDKKNGDTLWVRSFGDASKGQGQCEYAFDKMSYQNGVLNLVGGTSVNYSGTNRFAQATISFDEDGKVLSALRIENPVVEMTATSIFSGSLYDPYSMAGVQYRFSDSSDLYVYRLNKDNSTKWAWRLPTAGIEAAHASIVLPDTSLVVVGYNQTSTGADGILVKTSVNGKLENCSNDPFSALATPLTITSRWHSLSVSAPLTDSTRVTDLTAIPGYSFSFNLLCTDANACRLGKILGPSMVCAGTRYLYKVNRTGDCSGPVRFLNTGNAITSIVSDTSVELVFPRAGTYRLSANLDAACRTLQDSITITVSDGAAKVTLGTDTTLCTGTQITLQANSGFVNYLWQDGSTNSFYVVKQQGLYHVAATDACGNIFKDSVVVNEVTSVPIYVGLDRIKCNDDTVHLNAPSGFLNYSWSNNYNISSLTSQNVIVNPLTDTAYYIRAEKEPGCFAYDTVRIHVNTSPAINLGADKSLCDGDSVLFDAGSGFNEYLWSNGAGTKQISAKTAGMYSVTGTTAEGCKSYDTVKVVNVFSNPVVSLDHNPLLCTGSSRILDAGKFSSYLWNDGSASEKIIVNGVGTYAVEVRDDNGCKGSDTTIITTILPLPTGFLPPDTLLCSYDKLTLVPRKPYNSYLWSTGATASSITISQPGEYWLEVRDANGCAGRDSVVVNPKDCMEGFYIPTAFTPNHDGKNDVFRPLLFGKVKKYQFTIYNRWGQVVFQTPDLNKAWDGSVAGLSQDSNVFVWMCTYQFEGEEVRTERGTVMVIR